jgi:predicted O-methyltransferase YrrM
VGILAKNSAPFIEDLLRASRTIADELVIGVDSSSTDTTEEVCRQYADKIFRLEPIGTSERALAWLNEQCTGDWILRLDHDELPSTGLVQALEHLMDDREFTHYWLPRRWIVGDKSRRWIAQHPWWPDWQVRFFRNIRSLVSFPGDLHTDYALQGAGGYFANGSIYHFNLVVNSDEQRQKNVENYESLAPGNALGHFYFPNLASIVTRPIPDDDTPFRATPTRKSVRAVAQKLGRLTTVARSQPVPHVTLKEMDNADRQHCTYTAEMYQAALVIQYCPPVMTAGELCPVELEVQNLSSVIWPGPGLGAPAVRVSYHWKSAAGEIYESEGLRTDLPLTLRPGKRTKVIAQVMPPHVPGQFALQWDLVIEWITWFSSQGWQGPEIDVCVEASTSGNASETPIGSTLDLVRWGTGATEAAKYVRLSSQIPGWIRGSEAEALLDVCRTLPEGATVVEVGAFLGSSTVLMAGARAIQGSGQVHSIDPFDASGDAFSTPVYNQIRDSLGGGSLRERFDEYIRSAELTSWVTVYQDVAPRVAATWSTSIDLLFLDGDMSRLGARAAYECWEPFLTSGGIIALHNAAPVDYAEDHDGNRRIAVEEVLPPKFTDIGLVGATLFARKR